MPCLFHRDFSREQKRWGEFLWGHLVVELVYMWGILYRGGGKCVGKVVRRVSRSAMSRLVVSGSEVGGRGVLGVVFGMRP